MISPKIANFLCSKGRVGSVNLGGEDVECLCGSALISSERSACTQDANLHQLLIWYSRDDGDEDVDDNDIGKDSDDDNDDEDDEERGGNDDNDDDNDDEERGQIKLTPILHHLL